MSSWHCSPNGNTSCNRQGTEHYLLTLPKIHVKSELLGTLTATVCYETCLTITCDLDPESNVSAECDHSNRATWNKVDQSERYMRAKDVIFCCCCCCCCCCCLINGQRCYGVQEYKESFNSIYKTGQ